MQDFCVCGSPVKFILVKCIRNVEQQALLPETI